MASLLEYDIEDRLTLSQEKLTPGVDISSPLEGPNVRALNTRPSKKQEVGDRRSRER